MLTMLLQLTISFVFVMLQGTAFANDCGSTSFSGSSGVVSSPNFPLSYPDINCTYSIEVGRNNSVLLTFLYFDLEPSSSDSSCVHDWLMVTCNETNDENLDFRQRYCGTAIPRTSLRFSNCPVVQLNFRTDSTIDESGFSIHYTIESGHFEDNIHGLDCGQTVFDNNSSGVIRLPKNPTDYPATVHCIYTIATNNRNRIQLDILALQRTQLLDSFSNCSRDNITIGCVSDGHSHRQSHDESYDYYSDVDPAEPHPNPMTNVTYCRQSFPGLRVQPSLKDFHGCRLVTISIRSTDYNYRENHDLPFTIDAVDKACGVMSFTGPTGIITSPKFPLHYAHNLNCVYTIGVDRTKQVSLESISFKLEGTSQPSSVDECSYDWLTVRCLLDGSMLESPYRDRKFCGEKKNPMILKLSYCDSLTVNFVSDASVTYGGFQLQYTIISPSNASDVSGEGCVNTSFTDPVGFISSPLFPLSYPDNSDCVYSIDVDPTEMVVLRFLSFNIEGTSHSSTFIDSCYYDWLMISCLSNSSVSELSQGNRKYCGKKETPFILGYSKCDSLKLNFVTDSSINSGGFQLTYKISSADQPDCGDASFSGPYGVVTSPKYPFLYPHNMICKYFIDVGRSNSVLLKFKNFDLETPDSMDQCKDWLTISCNETTKANPNYGRKYCGSIQWISSMRFLDCPSLVLEFVSDSSNNSKGFVIEYTVVDDSNSTDDNFVLDCGTTLFNSSSGSISLPRNPKNHLAVVNCTYTISANDASYIWLNSDLSRTWPLFQSFQDCDRESLTITCSSDDDAELNSNTTSIFCRRGRDPYYLFPRAMLFADCSTLKFSILSTNYDNQATLQIPFSVYGEYELCGNTSFSAPSGNINSKPLFVSLPTRLLVDCLYTIDTGHVNTVVLNLDRLHFGYSIQDESCAHNWLMITCLVNGTSMPHPLANRKLCQRMQSVAIRFPACQSVLLNYSVVYVMYSSMGFTMSYRTGDYDSECGNTSFSGPNGFITSPQFPLHYAHNLNCLYSIAGGQRNFISLSFLSFHLEGTSSTISFDSCTSDWLTVSCMSDQSALASDSSIRKYCGPKTTPLNFQFPNCDAVVLNFRSDHSVTYGGFKISYTVINTDSICGALVYGPPSGAINVPMNSTDNGYYFECNYTINATVPSTISMTIWSISLQSSDERSCTSVWLLINCINSQNAFDHKVSHRSCDNYNSRTQLTFPSCTVAKVVYHKDTEATGRTFRIEYTVTSQGDDVFSTDIPSTTVRPTDETSCATGCRLSPNATHCECLPVSTEIPVTRVPADCEVGCTKNADGTTCDCSTTHSGNVVVNTQMNLTGTRGHAVGISMTVILVVIGAICLGAFWLFRRHRKKNRPEMLIQASELEARQLELEDDTTKSGSLYRAYRNEDRDTSRYLALSDHEDRSSNNCTLNQKEIQPGF